ncbi:hypothetical protein ACNJYA_04350 [Bradyrhizobium sp. DASA03068]|uniref:hypothetical protein n=1 Tax=Bradyrhizobium sp. BLXBL-01 TaxID=3395915 RepID=UPI003F724C78
MLRRDFLGLICGATAWSHSARAQRSKPLGSLELTEPSGKPVHINIALVTFVRSDTHISGANAELGLASGKSQGVRENVDEVMQLIMTLHRGEMSWIKLTEPNGKLIHINVSQVTTVRFEDRIPGANAELGFASGKLQGVRESVDDVMRLITVVAGQKGKSP